MSKNSIANHDVLYEYLKSVSVSETPDQVGLREETSQLEMAVMQISPDQGQFMAMLVKLLNAKQIVEVGTFTGYSALAMALALPEDGMIYACDISEEWTAIGKKYWASAEVDQKIDLRIAPAMDTLNALLSEKGENQFDMAFIDADKNNYDQYYEACLKLIRPNGVILIDNVFWDGLVADPSNTEEDTVCIRMLNDKVYSDNRVEVSMISVGDGLSLVRKK